MKVGTKVETHFKHGLQTIAQDVEWSWICITCSMWSAGRLACVVCYRTQNPSWKIELFDLLQTCVVAYLFSFLWVACMFCWMSSQPLQQTFLYTLCQSISASSSLVSQSSSCLSVFFLAFKRSASNEVVKLHNWPAAHGRINTHCMHGGHSIYGYNSKPLSLGYVCPLT